MVVSSARATAASDTPARTESIGVQYQSEPEVVTLDDYPIDQPDRASLHKVTRRQYVRGIAGGHGLETSQGEGPRLHDAHGKCTTARQGSYCSESSSRPPFVGKQPSNTSPTTATYFYCSCMPPAPLCTPRNLCGVTREVLRWVRPERRQSVQRCQWKCCVLGARRER